MNMFVYHTWMSQEHQVALDHTYASPYVVHASPIATSIRTTQIDWPPAEQRPYFYIGIYAAITFSVAFVNVLSAVTQYTGALRASRKLFKQLLVGVVRATMRWHDVTPQGQLRDHVPHKL